MGNRRRGGSCSWGAGGRERGERERGTAGGGKKTEAGVGQMVADNEAVEVVCGRTEVAVVGSSGDVGRGRR